MRWSSWGIVLSVAAHAGLAAAIVAIPKGAVHKSMLVSVADKKKKKDDKKEDDQKPKVEEPPAKPVPLQAPRSAPKPKPAPENTPPPPPANTPPSAAAHPALAALPNLGISMAGGPGMGIAVPVGPAAPDPAGGRPTEAVHAAPKPREDDCAEAEVKAKLQGAFQRPTYTESARTAGVEGKIRLELQIDATGAVTSVRVATGLGHGLDEAAVAAAKRAKFAPATRCGKAVASRFVISMPFRLED